VSKKPNRLGGEGGEKKISLCLFPVENQGGGGGRGTQKSFFAKEKKKKGNAYPTLFPFKWGRKNLWSGGKRGQKRGKLKTLREEKKRRAVQRRGKRASPEKESGQLRERGKTGESWHLKNVVPHSGGGRGACVDQPLINCQGGARARERKKRDSEKTEKEGFARGEEKKGVCLSKVFLKKRGNSN